MKNNIYCRFITLFLLFLFYCILPALANTTPIYLDNKLIGAAIQVEEEKYFISPDVLGRALKIPIIVGEPSGNVRLNGILLERLAVRTSSGWLVPVREIVEVLGYKYNYDKNSAIVNIFTGTILPVGDAKTETPPGKSNTKTGEIALLDSSGRNRQINKGAEGELLNIEQHLVKGKTNIVEFYSDY